MTGCNLKLLAKTVRNLQSQLIFKKKKNPKSNFAGIIAVSFTKLLIYNFKRINVIKLLNAIY